MINFSAADLVKKSASQIAYFEMKKLERVASPRQIKGNQYSDEVVQKLGASSEKRGTIIGEKYRLYFCIDMIQKNVATEIKMVDGEYEEWYLQSSIIQSAYYAQLLKSVQYLDTPKFKIKEGYEQDFIDTTNIQWKYELLFGNKKYSVEPCYRLQVHFEDKIDTIIETLTSKNWFHVKKWDSMYKFKEWEEFKKYIKFKPI